MLQIRQAGVVHFTPECLVHFGPERLAHYSPEWVVQFTPERVVQYGPEYSVKAQIRYQFFQLCIFLFELAESA
jgi:hypothetical protein